MTAVQMNTRIDASLKRRGDATLERCGKSASEAVRGLWTYLAEEGTLPDFLADDSVKPPTKSASQRAAEGAGLVRRMASEYGIAAPPAEMSYEDLRNEAFGEKYASYRLG